MIKFKISHIKKLVVLFVIIISGLFFAVYYRNLKNEPEKITVKSKSNKYVPSCLKAGTKNCRFGESLEMIHTCLYLSAKYNIPFIYYAPFEHSDYLKFSIIKSKFDLSKCGDYKKIVRIFKESDIDLNASNIIYEVRYNFIKDKNSADKSFYMSQADKEFKLLIQPLDTIKLNTDLVPPENPFAVNIALHVRKGGGYDYPLLSKDGLSPLAKNTNKNYPMDAQERATYYSKGIGKWICKIFRRYIDLIYPYKFPADSFYIAEVKKIIKNFPNKPINIVLFTDDRDPKKLADKYKMALDNNQNINFIYRKVGNFHNKYVVDDFFAMAKYDYLIRPSSAFSIHAQKIGDFKSVICPKHAVWVLPDVLIVDQTEVIVA